MKTTLSKVCVPTIFFLHLLFLFPTDSHSEPILWKTINIRAAGIGKRMLLGDVTGDGRLEMIMMQPNKMADDRYIGHEVNCLTIYDLDGNQLWQIGNPSAGGAAGSDIPAQVYDIDLDGYNEVLACMNGKVRIFDGRDGKEKSSFSYPHKDAHDCIVIANLTGNPKPQDIIVKNRYSQIWALDRTGKLLWTHKGNTGHFPWPFDFDYDGREEIICGYDFLTPDGRKVWSINQGGHADCIWVADIDGDPSNGAEIAVGGDDVTVYHNDGKLLWRNNQPVEPQNIAIGDFLPDEPGLEIAGQDRINRGSPGREAIFVISNTGKMSYYQTRSGWGSIAYMCHNWDGSGSDHIMIWRGPDKPALYDGKVRKVANFNEGYMMAGDMNGDGIDEIITFTEDYAYIYTHTNVDLSVVSPGTPAPRPQQKRHYNFTRYWGGEYVTESITKIKNENIHTNQLNKKSIPYEIHYSTHAITITATGNSSLPRFLELCTINGRTVATLRPHGTTSFTLNLKGMSSGVYLLKAHLGNSLRIEKILIK